MQLDAVDEAGRLRGCAAAGRERCHAGGPAGALCPHTIGALWVPRPRTAAGGRRAPRLNHTLPLTRFPTHRPPPPPPGDPAARLASAAHTSSCVWVAPARSLTARPELAPALTTSAAAGGRERRRRCGTAMAREMMRRRHLRPAHTVSSAGGGAAGPSDGEVKAPPEPKRVGCARGVCGAACVG
eukprot:COSAG01_NODE_4391_length_5072_cov_2.913533_3_plen_184_part_00